MKKREHKQIDKFYWTILGNGLYTQAQVESKILEAIKENHILGKNLKVVIDDNNRYRVVRRVYPEDIAKYRNNWSWKQHLVRNTQKVKKWLENQ